MNKDLDISIILDILHAWQSYVLLRFTLEYNKNIARPSIRRPLLNCAKIVCAFSTMSVMLEHIHNQNNNTLNSLSILTSFKNHIIIGVILPMSIDFRAGWTTLLMSLYTLMIINNKYEKQTDLC